jgi:predicted nucleic acid-binding protein
MNVVVQDTSTLLNLLKTGLIRQTVECLGLHIFTTDLVAREVVSQKAAFDTAVANGWIEIKNMTAIEVFALVTEQQKAKGLTLQDISVVSLARDLKCPLFSSDGPLRTYAHACRIIVHKDEHLQPAEAACILRAMLADKARLPAAEVTSRLTKWDAP